MHSQTPLHVAALTRQTSALKLLLKGGANVAAVDRHGETILHLAAKFDYEECLQLVLEFLREAEPKDALKVVDALNFHGYSALHLAVMRQHVGCVKLLTSAQLGSVNLPDGCSGRTALHHAVEMESLPLVGHLVIEVSRLPYPSAICINLASVSFAGEQGLKFRECCLALNLLIPQV